ncbi:mitochondrial ribosomal subunit protein-domain-containing protein [Protomyces lactucae-debilis]|uniref:Mitochondrial ribosomal subunit protein-domain-containing protein n=1 Tax=Protomyces lactucae-debilis TaxID=2754530 RepID=A0A1Y2FSX0_PROLT|nr:mitochondrial ribosomal subunit protein-domain-containing protein [Protomyces lactucae-debilis]ORY87092.1 mitochondrial ribosomal subunit protein-domain-containing protein [Protomyces lactucae-debilis]
MLRSTATRQTRAWSKSCVRHTKQVAAKNTAAEDAFGLAATNDVLLEDMTSLQMDELHEHRQLRDYYRKIIYELPQLEALKKPPQKPSATQVLQFRQTTYFGEEHPAMHKVTLQVKLRDLAAAQNLSPVHLSKLVKLAGTRVDHDTLLLRMSSEQFGSAKENRRHLSAVLDKLLAECQQGDLFEDVPMDRRHMKKSKRPSFPKHWRVPQPVASSKHLI